MNVIKLEHFVRDIVSMYPLSELQKEQIIRRFILRQISEYAYEQGCYQNKINYIVWRLGL